MLSASEWSFLIQVFSVLIMLSGVLSIILSFAFGIVQNWVMLLGGLLYLAVAVKGFYAGLSKNQDHARQYVVALIGLFAIQTSINIINIPINLFAVGICDYDKVRNTSLSEQQCTTSFLVAAFTSLAVSTCCCLGCISCGRKYYLVLQREGGQYYTTEGDEVEELPTISEST